MSIQPVEIIPGPGVIVNDFALLRKRAELVSSYVDWIQIDIADNKLVPNKTSLDPEKYRQALSGIDVNFELHMMVKDPLSIIDSWINAGFKRLLLHVEGIPQFKIQNSKVKNAIQNSKLKGVEIGLAVDKETPVDVVRPYLNVIDCVLIMTIAAGFSGQKFIPGLLEKVKSIRAQKPDMPIEVDGGITIETARFAVEAGATRLAVTSEIYNADNIEEAIERLKNK